MATITASAAGGNWSATTAWEGAKVPTAADDVILATGSGSITVAAAAACRSLEASAYKATLKVSEGITLSIGTTTSNAGLCVTIGAAMTMSGAGTISFVSTSGTVEKIKAKAKAFTATLKFNAIGGKWQLEETLEAASMEVAKGELKTNGFTVTATASFTVGAEGTLTAGASLYKTKKFTLAEAATFNCGTGSIELTGASATVGGATAATKTSSPFNIVIIGVDGVEIVGSNTFAELRFNTAGMATGTKFTKEAIQTVGALVSNGKAGSLVKLLSTTAGKAWILKSAQGFISADFLELKDSHAQGATEWFAGANSTSVSGNEGWKFEARPVTSGFVALTSHSAVLEGASVKFTRPAGVKAGDILIFHISMEAANPELSITMPAGWELISRTLVGGGRNEAYYWLRYVGPETEWEVKFGEAETGFSWSCFAYRGAIATGNPIDNPTIEAKEIAGAEMTHPGITTQSSREIVVASGSNDQGFTFSAIGGAFTERFARSDEMYGDAVQKATGATGGITMKMSGSKAGAHMSILVFGILSPGLMTVAQAQSASVAHAIVRALTTTSQAQVPKVNHGRTRSLPTVAQAQAVTRVAAPARVLAVGQGQVLRGLPIGAILDTFNRVNEKPLNDGGLWALLHGDVLTGEVVGEHWKATSTFAAGEDGVYYTATEFTNPSIIADMLVTKMTNERWLSLYSCVTNPTTAEISGYRVILEQANETEAPLKIKLNIRLEKIVKGEASVVAEVKEVTTPNEPHKWALTVQGGVIPLWREVGGTWSELLQGHDTAFSSGFVGFGGRGNVGAFDAISAASQPAASLSKNVRRILTASQGQSATATPKESTRTIAVAVTQVVSKVVAVARSLSTTQSQAVVLGSSKPQALSASASQSPSLARALTRRLAVSQGQAPSVGRARALTLSSAQGQLASLLKVPARSLSPQQPQAANLVRGIARALGAAQTQVATRLRSPSRTLSQAQGASASLGSERVTVLVAAQPQSASRQGALTRTLATSQPQAATRQTTVGRLLLASSGSVGSFLRAVARSLRVAQAQEASQAGSIEHHEHSHALSTTQGQVVGLTRNLGRRLSASIHASPAVARSVSRLLRASAASTVTLRRELPVLLAATNGQSATVAKDARTTGVLVTTAGQSAVIVRSASRELTTTQATAAIVTFERTEVPLPPPVKMSTSTSSITPTSSAAPNRLAASVGSSRLDSSAGSSRLSSSAEAR